MEFATELYQNDKAYKQRLFSFVRDVVCSYYNVDKEMLEVKSRKGEVVKAKHTSIYFCLKNIKTGPSELAKFFGCDHATVIHAKRKLTGYLMFDKDLNREFTDIQNLILKRSVDNADNYYIDLNNCVSMKQFGTKAIIMVGYSEGEIKQFTKHNSISIPTRAHSKTGLYILEKNGE